VYTTSDKPLVGICFGHQILGRALAAKVGRNPEGWEVAVSKISLTDKGRKIFGGDSLVSHMYILADEYFILTIRSLEPVGPSPDAPGCGFDSARRTGEYRI